MAHLTVATVSTGLVSPTTLNLLASPYFIEGEYGLDAGPTTFEKSWAESPWVHGKFPVHQKRGLVRSTIQLRVEGATQAALQTNIDAVIDAFTQFQFNLVITIGPATTATYQWVCYAADVYPDWYDERWVARKVPVRFEFDRSPIPTSGPL